MPKAVRDALGARPGDDIEFVTQGEELIVEVRSRRAILDFAGIAADSAERLLATAEDLDEVMARGMTDAAVARDRRARRSPRPTT